MHHRGEAELLVEGLAVVGEEVDVLTVKAVEQAPHHLRGDAAAAVAAAFVMHAGGGNACCGTCEGDAHSHGSPTADAPAAAPDQGARTANAAVSARVTAAVKAERERIREWIEKAHRTHTYGGDYIAVTHALACIEPD